MLFYSFKEFMGDASFWTLLLIIVAKVIEVSVGTLRIIMINKGFRLPATVLAFIEIMLWVFIASTVINGLTESMAKGLAYGVGFTIGVYIGSIVESKLAFGRVNVQAIVSRENEVLVLKALRDKNLAVTSVDAHGMHSEKAVLMIFAERKNAGSIIKIIEQADEKAVIVVNDISTLRKGYMSKRGSLLK